MADLALGELLTLVCGELAESVRQSSEEDIRGVRMRVRDLDLDVPARIRFGEARADEEQPGRLMIGLPSQRETAVPGRLGRLHLTILTEYPDDPRPGVEEDHA